ncbi:fibrous sheath CABYR-binding protein [Bicyclus anynana]|uniref:Fibrous sheath CABYR-binding protein n=1 Tax=Bicyclus anynana TaxID=110368 RepID=A0A6J1MXY9_BICAN|nr:fibrous sheath CABYR-binding protein [Bicyclus anynana]
MNTFERHLTSNATSNCFVGASREPHRYAGYKGRPPAARRSSALTMRAHAFLLALCVCAHHARAASIPQDLDNVDLDDDINVVIGKAADIPVKVIEEPVIDENSNDYIPPDDVNVVVKRIEVDLRNPGPPQRQEHETQNPDNQSDNDKVVVAIRHSLQQTEEVFNEGLKHVSDSFKTFLQADEDLPLIQQNIKNLKDTFAGQFEKLNATIRSYLPVPAASDESAVNPKAEVIQAHLKFLDNSFQLGVGTLAEGVEVYSIIKEEDEAEKAIALKADLKAEPEVAAAASEPAKPAEHPPAQPAPANPAPPASPPFLPWNQYLTNLQNSIGGIFQTLTSSITNTFGNNNNPNGQAQAPPNPVVNFIQGIPSIFQGTNTVAQPPAATPEKPQDPPANAQADPVPAAPATPAPWSPQAILQSVQTTWNNIVNPGQNNQPQNQQPNPPQQQPTNNNPFQQAYQNFVSFITPQTPQAQQPANPQPAAPAAVPPPPATTPESASAIKPEAPVQGSNAVPAPVNDQPQQQPTQANPAPVQPGPIQQLVQNNPIIKGIQDAVQRIQGTPNPETPREEPIKEEEKKEEVVDPKGHGGYRPNNNVANQGSTDDSRVEDKVEENLQDIPPEEKEVLEEQIKAEELKTPSVADKTE